MPQAKGSRPKSEAPSVCLALARWKDSRLAGTSLMEAKSLSSVFCFVFFFVWFFKVQRKVGLIKFIILMITKARRIT